MANGKPGRPRRVWTDDEVDQFKKLCAIFCTRAECASVLGMDVRTLDANIAETFPDTPTWGEAFERFSATGKATLRRRMFELAMDGEKAAIIFMAKNYLGMSDAPAPAKTEPKKKATLTVMESSKFAGRMAGNG